MDDLGALGGGAEYDPFGVDPVPASRLDDRRVQIRIYRRWVSLLRGRSFPAIHDMGIESLEGPHSLLLDLRGGNGDPAISRIGRALRKECGEAEIHSVRDVPADSLLSRLTGHYPFILATGEPLAFEGEETGPLGERILYRAILLPLSDGRDRIDYIAGMLTWREFADSAETAALAFEVGRSLGGFQVPVQPAWGIGTATAFPEAAHPELPLSA